ncbi:MAG: helix-turn-helix domain-containing protein [Nitrososphaerota archaeon]|nr:helix-turn-helix domain-containing protein [Nitrososphaerota archaeon]
MKLRIDRRGKRELKRLLSVTKDKKEYRRALGVLMRAQKKRRRVKDIARELDVSIDAVERWLRAYRKRGIEGIRARKPSGRPVRKRNVAVKRIRELLKQDPRAFGFLKGRWVVRDIAKALSQEGIDVSRSYVHDMLKGLGLAYKRPKLDVKSNDPNYYRKAKEVGRYKRAASMLAKRGSWSGSRTRPGPRFTPESKPSG